MNLYYLGPKGTFSHQAAQRYITHNQATLVPQKNLFEVIQSVTTEDGSLGIVPIENSIEGTINVVADALALNNVYAIGELRLDITFNLYGLQDSDLSEITKVYSIAPAISQTQNFIHQHKLNYEYVDSTVAGFKFISHDVGVIAPSGSGEPLGYRSLYDNIQDYPHNITRFLVIKDELVNNKEGTQTMMLITPQIDQPGTLANILNTFSMLNINLSWIESRPLKTQLGMYRFFVQAEMIDQHQIDKVINILETLNYNIELIGRFNQLN
ncbi:prephenate dehydratase [Staphylococcus sp. SQ8-PEA]|uniref:Prephenate dehydratase n=1 Tax=Staphylococcus marylandisciuri TaxID=2981529 RepID=A0ABT2QQE6_9STAP|nr:prephenate dehydratase domain-containing protein [Staphylococcus marylandisciuri]MCU5746191.1 prephenate dehydratase [Staphylococcus marylandisciuri]